MKFARKIRNFLTAAPRGNSLGIVFGVMGFALNSFSDVAYKYVSGTCPVMVMGFYGFLSTMIFTMIAAAARGGLRRHLATQKPGLHVFRGLVMLANFFLFIYGLSGLPVAQTYVIDNLSPMVAALLAVLLLKEKLAPYVIGCILVGFAGVLIVLRPGIVPLNIYAVAILCSTVTFALMNIITRKIGERDSTLTFGLYGVGTMLVPLALYNLHLGWVVPSARDLAVLLLCGAFSFFGGLANTKAFMIADVAVVSKFQYTTLLWGGLLGYLLFGDVPDVWVVVGGAVIIGSGVYLAWRENRRSAREIMQFTGANPSIPP